MQYPTAKKSLKQQARSVIQTKLLKNHDRILYVNGKIEGNVVVVAGNINGDMLVHERLEVNSTANLHGEVHVPSGQLLIQEGAYMEGQCITSKNKQTTKQLGP